MPKKGVPQGAVPNEVLWSALSYMYSTKAQSPKSSLRYFFRTEFVPSSFLGVLSGWGFGTSLKGCWDHNFRGYFQTCIEVKESCEPLTGA